MGNRMLCMSKGVHFDADRFCTEVGAFDVFKDLFIHT